MINNTQSNGIPVVSYSKGSGSSNVGNDHAYSIEWGGDLGYLVLGIHVDNQTPVILDNGHYGSPTPVYRIKNPSTGEHFFSIDKNEIDNAINKGWESEGDGIAFYAMSRPR